MEKLKVGEKLFVEVELYGYVFVMKGDKVVVLGMKGEEDVEWGFDKEGRFWFEVMDEVVKGDKYVWVFKIEYSYYCK